MDKITTENLFLLEFLVDSVTLDKKCECDAPPGETCVSFQFLDNAPLDVCEADFNPKRDLRCPENESVKSGKSCLFSLSPEQASAGIEQFDICVTVMKKMQPGWLPEKVEIGASVIGIANLFNELISSVELSDGSSPTAKTLKDVFDINDAQGQFIGKISVYIRMSCFGKLIVTQFQMNLDDKSVLFKDKEGRSLYRYKKAGKKKDAVGGGPAAATGAGYNASCPQMPCPQPSGGQPPSQPSQPIPVMAQRPQQGSGYDCPFGPCGGSKPTTASPTSPPMSAPMPMTPMAAGYPGGGYSGPGFSGGGYPGASYPGGGYPSGGFGTQTMMAPCNECGFVPNAACLPPMGSPAMMGGYNEGPIGTRPPSPPDGNYQEIGASMGGNSLTIRVHKDKGKAEQLDPNAMDDCICGGEGGGTAGPLALVRPGTTQQAFSMRPGATPNTPFSFRMGQCGDPPGTAGSAGQNVVVNPPVYTAPDGTQFTEFSDPNKETFILRIGKKSEGVDKKNNLELELQTPKGPPLKPIPKKETVETQYDPLDAGSEDTGSKKAAKAGGKGGKGGKKKK